MAQNDLISDVLTRIRNAQMVRHATVMVPSSKLVKSVLDVLVREGYLEGYEVVPVRNVIENINVVLKYHQGVPVINKISRASKPALRKYTSLKNMKKVFNGMGISVLTTSKGVMSDEEAKAHHVGGELICTVF